MQPLKGRRIILQPLQPGDARALVEAARDGELWNLPFTQVPSPDTIDHYLAAALNNRDAGTALPFVTRLKSTGEVIGYTCFGKIERHNHTLEIGNTWIARSWQRSFVNTEAKYLMLSHAFEDMACIRVQFTTDEINHPSRTAILRLGAQQEGIVRHERIMPDGRKRNAVRFSIIDDEWPRVRQHLLQLLGQPWPR